MNLLDLIERKIPPDLWAEGEKIPWHNPGSEVHLTENLRLCCKLFYLPRSR